MRQSTKFISVLLLITILAACAPAPAQESALPPAPSATPTPLPTQTPEPTATATPVPEPYRIAAGYLERWDGAAYQQMVAASSYLVDASQEWVTAFDSYGMPVAAYHAASGLVLQPGETGLISLDGVPHVWNPEKLTWDRGEIWRAYGGSLQQWDEARGRYVDVKTGLDKNESLEVDELLRDETSGLLVAIEQGKIVVMLDEASRAVVETPLGIAFRPDGWGRVYHQGVMENYLRIEGGIATAYDSVRQAWLPVLAADGAPVQASGNIKKVDGTGFLVLSPDETTLAVLLDTTGNLIPAYNSQVPIGLTVYRFEGGLLAESSQNWFEFMASRPDHNTIEVVATDIGFTFRYTVNWRALGPVKNGVVQAIEGRVARPNDVLAYWLELFKYRMEQDGYGQWADRSAFTEYLQNGGELKLAKLGAYDARTGELRDDGEPNGPFTDVPVKQIVIYATNQHPEDSGAPPLPVRMRYAHTYDDLTNDALVYDPQTGTLIYLGARADKYLVKDDNLYSMLIGLGLYIEWIPARGSVEIDDRKKGASGNGLPIIANNGQELTIKLSRELIARPRDSAIVWRTK